MHFHKNLYLQVMLLTLLVILAGAALAQTNDPAVVQHCQQLMNPAPDQPTGPTAPSIHIVEPANGGTVYGRQVAVTVDVQNFEINQNGQHWHVWVDGQLQMMVYGPTALLNVAPGSHELCAILGDVNHLDIGAPAGIIITVADAGAGTPTVTPPISPEQAAATQTPETREDPAVMILVLAGALLVAGVGGWWVGGRLSRRRR